jgi:electron transport complex protein RnfG
MLQAIRKNGVTLAVFAFASTGLVAVTHHLTEDRIAEQEKKQLQRTLDQVIDPNLYDNALYNSCVLLSDPLLGSSEPLPAYIATQADQPVAMAVESIAPNGYNGKITLITGIDMNGEILGTRVLSHQETPGLGDKIDTRVSDWIFGFTGKLLTAENQSSWQVRKDGGDFDQFTGATITPRAVVQAVKNTLNYVQQNQTVILEQSPSCGEQS